MEQKENTIDTVMLVRSLEAICEIVFKLGGLYLVYYWGSTEIIKDNSDTLFSILLLPALLILKNCHIISDPFTVKAYIGNSDVTVINGLLTRKNDRLTIETLENIELVKTPLGRLCNLIGYNYGTLNLYAYGGTVVMPYLRDPEKIQERIQNMRDKAKIDAS